MNRLAQWSQRSAEPELAEFFSELDRRLLNELPGSRLTLAEISASAGGAFPTLVADRLSKLGCAWSSIEPRNWQPTDPSGPELHAAEFEWYFTNDNARDLADWLPKRGDGSLLLGVPTVAGALSARRTRTTIVDRSPFLRARFPGLIGTSIQHDLLAPIGLLRTHDAVFFDAPWHEDHVRWWLWQASVAVRRGGSIAFALFGELTRPRARAERQRIFDLAVRLGRVRVFREVLQYRTPRFEREAMNAAGLNLGSPWRRGDLVLIENVDGLLPRPPRPWERTWHTRTEGRQVIKVSPELKAGSTQANLANVSWRRLSTVSRNATRAMPIAVWTSRSRVISLNTTAAADWSSASSASA